MIMIREEITKLIEKSIKDLQEAKKLPGFEIPEIKIEKPEHKEHGDYSTNIAMVIAKTTKGEKEEIASKISEKINNYRPDLVNSIWESGFVNLYLEEPYLQKRVRDILKEKDKFGDLKIGKNQKVNIEFISANPTGELHLGHGRGAFYGDVLSNVFQKAGYKVVREYLINDTEQSKQIVTFKETIKKGSGPYYSEYVKKKILEDKDNVIANIQKDIEDFIKNRLKIKFDNWISEEKDLYQKSKIKKIKDWLDEKNLTYKKDKAIWLKASKYGDIKDWVVIRETGEPTYLLSDAAYHKDKFDRKFDKIIDIWGADHQGHAGKIKAIAKMLNYKGDLDILISQVVRLKKGKISKRKGEVVTLEWLIDEVGLDATRFFYLMKSLNTQMEFDVGLAKEKSAKSPVYYVQYAHARICSILRKTRNTVEIPKLNKFTGVNLLQHKSELNLIKQLIRLPEVVEDTARDYQVQRLPQYAMEIAAVFHQFYQDCRVISDNKELTQARLGLVLSTKIVLKNTLELMGISAPERM